MRTEVKASFFKSQTLLVPPTNYDVALKPKKKKIIALIFLVLMELDLSFDIQDHL